jgi:hypothetical protein
MQVYRIKLGEGHTAEANQVSKDGFLCDENGIPYLYSAERARLKAKRFGGKREKFGKKYTTSVVRVIQFDIREFSEKTLEYLQANVAYTHSAGIGNFMCYANVFDELLEQGSIPEDIQDELKQLAYICLHYDYVQVLAV